MRVHLQRDVDNLKKRILALSAEVESDVRAAVRAVEDRDAALARRVIDREAQTNAMEVDVEDECLKILALHQPVAADLRYIIAVLKINRDLERIGDLAVHIAERGLSLCGQPAVDTPFRLGEMANKAQAMLKKVLDAFVNVDGAMAREVRAADSEVDDINRDILRQVKKGVVQNPSLLDPLLQIMHIARHLERIADHATNIAEDLLYLIEGRIVRHTPEAPDGNASGARQPAAAGPALRILFLCVHNSCRSQMAEGWARALKRDAIEAYSAGTDPRAVDPLAVKAMAEAGVDISAQGPKSVDALKDVCFDHVVTLCGGAGEDCPAWLKSGARVTHAGFDDPPALAREAGNEEDAMVHYRRVRDEIRRFVASLPAGLE